MPRRDLIPRSSAVLALAVLACTSATRTAPSSSYDVVITNARIVDGTGNPWRYGDIGLRGDRIAAVTPAGALAGAATRRRINAESTLVAAPGFIDIQGQSYDGLLTADGRMMSKVTQGVTTEILGEGSTPAPSNANVRALFGITPNDTAGTRWSTEFSGPRGFGHWLSAMERHPNSVNVGSFLGAETVRAYAKGQAQGAPTAAELDTMRRVVRDAMRDGAFGVASALIYPPGSYATTDELVEIAKAMAPMHGVYISHVRSEEEALLPAVDEAIEIGRRGGVPVEIYHLKASGPRNWPKAAAVVAKIDSARAAGVDVGATMYPYPASGNNLASCIPDWAAANGKLLDNIKDASQHTRIVAAMTDTMPGVPVYCQAVSPSAIMVVGFRKPELAQYEGKRLDEIAAALGKSWPDAVIDLTIREENRLGKLTFGMSEENIAMQLRRPWVVIGTDAEGFNPDSAKGLTHPRAYGSYPRILRKYVREEGVLTLEDAIRKMTSGVAERLSIPDRGLLREGMYADVVLFDPASITDRATYDRPHQLSTGVRHLFVNGVAVISDGAHTGAKPGRAVRGAGVRG